MRTSRELVRYEAPATELRQSVAAKIQRDVDLLVALFGGSAPHPLVILAQAGDLAEASLFHAIFCLVLGEAVGTRGRRAFVRCGWRGLGDGNASRFQGRG